MLYLSLMNILITHSQRNFILEYERSSYDKDYEEEYHRIKGRFIKYFENIIDSYFEDESQISLYDKDEMRLFTYRKISEELYYNSKINYFMTEFLPPHIWSRHSKYIISEVFNNFFDNPVRTVTSAGMN